MKFNKTILNLTILISSIFIFSGCTSKEYPDLKEFGPYHLEEACDYLCFDVGSFWIFENQFTGQLDTVTQTAVRKYMRTVKGQKQRLTYETIAFTQKHSFDGWENRFYQNTPPPDDPYLPRYRFILTTSGYRFGAYQGLNAMFWNPREVKQSQYTWFEGKLDTMEINGRTYVDVLKFKITLDGVYRNKTSSHTQYYWARNVGLIKRELFKEPDWKNIPPEEREIADAWELVEYHVEPLP